MLTPSHTYFVPEYLRNTSIDAVRFFSIAYSSGVCPSVFFVVESAPLARSNKILSCCCDDVAACKGVPRPMRLLGGYSLRHSVLISIPISSRYCIISLRPGVLFNSPAAECNASLSSSLAPCFKSSSKTAGVELVAVTSRMLVPGLPTAFGSAPCSRNHRVSTSSLMVCLRIVN